MEAKFLCQVQNATYILRKSQSIKILQGNLLVLGPPFNLPFVTFDFNFSDTYMNNDTFLCSLT